MLKDYVGRHEAQAHHSKVVLKVKLVHRLYSMLFLSMFAVPLYLKPVGEFILSPARKQEQEVLLTSDFFSGHDPF
jgi:hypothetical protein